MKEIIITFDEVPLYVNNYPKRVWDKEDYSNDYYDNENYDMLPACMGIDESVTYGG